MIKTNKKHTFHTRTQLSRPATGPWPGGWGSLGNTIPIQIIGYQTDRKIKGLLKLNLCMNPSSKQNLTQLALHYRVKNEPNEREKTNDTIMLPSPFNRKIP